MAVAGQEAAVAQEDAVAVGPAVALALEDVVEVGPAAALAPGDAAGVALIVALAQKDVARALGGAAARQRNYGVRHHPQGAQARQTFVLLLLL